MDDLLRSLHRLVQVHPDDIGWLRRYNAALERVVGGQSLDGLQQIADETSVIILRQMQADNQKYHEAFQKAVWARIDAIQAACQHQYGKPQYGIYIEETCEKCDKSEWY